MTGNLGPQFNPAQNEAIATALSIPADERRLRKSTERRLAAKRNSTVWALQVDHSSHDDLKAGITTRQQTHVLLSRDAYPDPMEAEQIAYNWGQERGTYPTRVGHV